MSWSSAAVPPSRTPPATLEARALFRVHTAALVERATPMKADPNVVLITGADGGMVAFAPSEKLAILAAERAKRAAPTKAQQT